MSDPVGCERHPIANGFCVQCLSILSQRDDARYVTCPVCRGTGSVSATFHYGEVEAECPYCGGGGKALRVAVDRDRSQLEETYASVTETDASAPTPESAS